MKFVKLATLSLPVLIAGVLVAGCGGGDDTEGAPVSLSVVPSELKVTWKTPDGSCPGTYAGRVFVYGGAGPYRLDNTSPESVQLSRNNVSEPGQSFDVTFTGGCIDPATVVVVDSTNRITQLTLRNVAEAAPPPASAPQ